MREISSLNTDFFVWACTMDILDNMWPLQHLPKKSCSSYICYVRLDLLMTNNSGTKQQPKSLNES